jgi:hypothetical protein
MTKAMHILTLIKNHKYEEALSHGTSTVKLLLSPATLEKALKDLPMGNVVSFKPVGVEKYGKNKVAKVVSRVGFFGLNFLGSGPYFALCTCISI